MASERTNEERARVIAGAAAASVGYRDDAQDYIRAVALRMIGEAVEAERARLTRELEEARRERSIARAAAMDAQAGLRRAERALEAARSLIREMVGAEPVFQDPRARYVEIQVSRAAWEEARRLLAANPKTSNN